MMMIIKGPKRSVKQITSAQTVASIDDLLTQILLLLPTKSLTRSKSVSKHWHSLITNPKFRRLRHLNPNPALGLLFCSNFQIRIRPKIEYVPFSQSTSAPSFKKLKSRKDPSGIRILQSCNGLLLCSSSEAHGINMKYHVYNPTTSRFSTLPRLEDSGNGGRVCGMNLAFDPALSPHYKVVCVRESESDSGEYRNQIEIYSSEYGQWRLCGEPFVEEVNFENGVFWNRSIHWISVGIVDSLYFNVEDHLLKIMPLPPIPHGWDWQNNHYFGESCDHLHYIEIVGPQIEFDVYEMKRDYSEWFVKYRVDLSPVGDAFPGMIRDGFDPTEWYYYAYSIFCVVRGKEEEDSFLVVQIPGKVITYNLVYKTFELVHEFKGAEMESFRFSRVHGFQYIKSLCV